MSRSAAIPRLPCEFCNTDPGEIPTLVNMCPGCHERYTRCDICARGVCEYCAPWKLPEMDLEPEIRAPVLFFPTPRERVNDNENIRRTSIRD